MRSLTHARLPLTLPLVALIALAGALPLAQADDAPASDAAPQSASQRTYVLAFDDMLPMEEFLTMATKTLGLQVAWNPNDKNIRNKKVKGPMRWEGTKQEVLGKVRAMLTFYDLVLRELGTGTPKTYAVMDARISNSILRMKPEYLQISEANVEELAGQDGRFITTTIRVGNMTDLRNARTALTRIVTSGNIGNVTEVPQSNSFVVTDFAPNVAAIYRLLREMDQPTSASTTTAYKTQAIQLKHAKAHEAADVLLSHFAHNMIGNTPQARGSQAVSHPARPRITPDSRTNQLLVSGTPSQIAEVRSTVQLIDVQVHAPEVKLKVIKVAHADVREAVDTLARVISGTPGAWTKGSRPNVVADGKSKTVIVSGSATDIARLAELLTQIDVP